MDQTLMFITERIRFLTKIRNRIAARSSNAPPGRLRINSRKGVDQYYWRNEKTDSHGKYIPKSQKSLAIELAQKDYDLEAIDAIDNEIKTLELISKKYPKDRIENIYDGLNEKRKKLIVPDIEPVELFVDKWLKMPYEGLSFSNEAPDFITKRGERVRSKSELIIANILNEEGIPYKYECPIMLKGYGTAYPDFTLLNLHTRREDYWEHFGMMDNPKYAVDAIRKLNCYESNGYKPGFNMIVTYETGDCQLNLRLVNMYIDDFKNNFYRHRPFFPD